MKAYSRARALLSAARSFELARSTSTQSRRQPSSSCTFRSQNNPMFLCNLSSPIYHLGNLPSRWFANEPESKPAPNPSPVLFIRSFSPEDLDSFRAELLELLNSGQVAQALAGLLKATNYALNNTPYQVKTKIYATLIYAYNVVADRLAEKGQRDQAELLISEFNGRINGAVFDSLAHAISYCAAKSNANAAASILKRMGPTPLTIDYVNRLLNYCGMNFHFALLFLESCRDMGATPTATSYNNLLDVYWKFSKENSDVKTDTVLRHASFCNLVLEKMRIENLLPTIAIYTIINRILLIAHDYSTPEVLRAEMKSFGIPPDVSYFNTLLALKLAQSDHAGILDLHKEMKELKIELDQFSYSSVIISSVKVGKIEKGEGLLDLMVVKGVQPSARSLNTFLFDFIDAGRVKTYEKVVALFDKYGYVMEESSANRLMHEYLKRGHIREAKKVERLLLDRGLTPSLSRPIEPKPKRVPAAHFSKKAATGL